MDYKTAEKRSHLMYEKILKRGYSEDEMSDILDHSNFEYHRGFAHAYSSKPQLTDEERELLNKYKKQKAYLENRIYTKDYANELHKESIQMDLEPLNDLLSIINKLTGSKG